MQTIQDRLSAYIDEIAAEGADAETTLRAFALVAQNVSRMARLLQAQALLKQPNNLEWLDKALEAVEQDVQNALAQFAHTFA
jgi:hypothetical protein